MRAKQLKSRTELRDEKQGTAAREEELRECTPEENAPDGPMQNSTRFGERLPLRLGSRLSPV